MSGLFSVSKLLGKSRNRNTKSRAVVSSSNASVISLAADKGTTSANLPKSLASSKLSTHVVTAVNNAQPAAAQVSTPSPSLVPTPKPSPIPTATPTPKDTQSLKADSIVEVSLPSDTESLRSFYATPTVEVPSLSPNTRDSDHKQVHVDTDTRTHSDDGKEEHSGDDEPDYTVVSSPEPKPSEEWTKLDNGDAAREAVFQEERDKAVAQTEARMNVLVEEKTTELETTMQNLEATKQELEAKTQDLGVTAGKLDTKTKELDAKTQELELKTKELDDARKQHKEELREITEERNKAQRRLSEVEAALKTAEAQTDEISSFLIEISNLTTQVTMLESEKTQLAIALEQGSRVSEIARLEEIITSERKNHEAEVEDLEKKLEDQGEKHFDDLEDVYNQLQTSEDANEGLVSRNQELETKLLHFENNKTTSRAEEDQKDHEMMLLGMKNTHIATQLLDVQNSLTSMERQNRMLYDQLRQQTNQLRASKNMTTSQSLTSKLGYVMGGGSSNTGPHVDSAVRTMRMLNDDIYQTAASMSDQLEAIAIRFVAEPGTRAALAANLKSTLGIELVTSLERGGLIQNDDDESTFYIQLQTALQGCLIACCTRIITSWYPTEWEYGVFLATMFERICGTEGVEKAKEWRNAVRKNCIAVENVDGKLIAMFKEEMLKVFNLSGWTNNPYVDMFKDQRHNLSEIAKLAMKLNQETAVGIPGELECIIADPGSIFNKYCMMNEDEFYSGLDRRSGQNAKPSSEQIISTVGLGLIMGKEDYEDEAHILLKPKVVLHGALF